MKNLLTAFLVLAFVAGFSQTKVQLEIEKEGDANQYKLKLERTIDGEKVVTEKTYSSIDEMKKDPDLKDVDINFIENGDNQFTYSGEGEDKNVTVEISKDDDHKMVFFTDGTNDEHDVDVKVWTDDDGKTHVLKNGKEIDIDGKYEKGENVFVFSTSDDVDKEKNMEVKVWIDEDGEHHVTVNGEEKDYEEWEKEHNNDVHFNFTTSEDGKHKTYKSEIIIEDVKGDSKDGNVRVFVSKSSNVDLHLEDITSEDAKTFALKDNKELKLDELNFYPNPSNGAFRLQFKGKSKPTLVKVADISGKDVFSEEVRNFEGSYDREIDLSGTPKGIYLLQVIQGDKAVNKKIVIE